MMLCNGVAEVTIFRGGKQMVVKVEMERREVEVIALTSAEQGEAEFLARELDRMAREL
jgi:hypothetical protein